MAVSIHPDLRGLAVTDKRLTPTSSLRGCGGVGIAWTKCLKVSPVTGIDSDSICAIAVKTSPAPTVVIGVYLSMTEYPMEEFQYHLITTEELINKHLHGPVCVASNFNAHVEPDGGPRDLGCPNHQGRLLGEVVHNNDFKLEFLY